jgi:hydroxypyruvate isomerase
VKVFNIIKRNYPYQQLFNLLAGINFNGWILLEAGGTDEPTDKIAAMKEQVSLFNDLVANIKKS